jgi:fructosamine-3-kinase
MLPGTLINQIQSKLSEKLGTGITVRDSKPLSGGDINAAFRLNTNKGNFFLKHNSASRYPGMFRSEARGLELLEAAKELDVPAVVDAGEAGQDAYLILEFIESAPQNRNFWESFGSSLARLHRHTNNYFGLDHDNYIGSLHQLNNKHERWTDFFIHERLERQLQLARKNGLADRRMTAQFERLFERLPDIFPEEPASLVHGDLWSGNYMTGSKGQAVIIDPAVYYGHREMDIGMSRLFGGFDAGFYESYNLEYPLAPGWQERVEICNLYPLMVHVNLFGGSYVNSVNNILRQF